MDQKKRCKWYDVCPLKRYYEEGRIDSNWVEEYCWQDNPMCRRRQLEEKGVYHPDNMMPDGSIDEKLG